jgi:XTP/dITP diphosphohydrolase
LAKQKIVLASNNAGKIRELNTLLQSINIELIPQSEWGIHDVEETGLSFVENALLKARHASTISQLPALADDSGLAVQALQGAPGIHSARYAGIASNTADNIARLLKELSSVPANQRTAYFYCALVFVCHAKDPVPLVCEGKWLGSILTAPQGEHGFGYDPVFYVPSENKSAAELTPELKNKLSHRGLAIEALLKQLPDKMHECTLSPATH